MKNIISEVISVVIIALVLQGLNLFVPNVDAEQLTPYKQTILYEEDAQSANRVVFPIDINFATTEELKMVKGIGDVMAQRIIDYRKQHHYFMSLEELKAVRGIGDATYDKISTYFILDLSAISEPAQARDYPK